jgi:peptide/nickel transport system substrate-binding protein
MSKQHRKNLFILITTSIIATLMSGCTGQPATEVVPTVEEVAPTVEEADLPVEGPEVGGTLVYAYLSQPDTMDWQASGLLITGIIDIYINGTMVAKDMEGNFVPYLAESWTISSDGLVYEFNLKEGVTFHNGDPLTAEDWVYTIERVIDPEFISPVTGGMVQSITEVEAVDDYTLKLTLDAPFFPMLDSFSSVWLAPVSKSAVEEYGENYGQNVVGVGPYMFEEWKQDHSITIVRNPDYNWGPTQFEGMNTGPYYIENITFRFLPEYSTQLAGLKAGDIDYTTIEGKDVMSIEDTDNYQVFEMTSHILQNFLFNVEEPPFDDILVRQAFTYATDREAVVQVALQGYGEAMYGPLVPYAIGYWSGINEYAPNFDLEKAKDLIQEAGYSYTPDGKLEKDGEPFKIFLKAEAIDRILKYSQIAQEQWMALGVDVELVPEEFSTLIGSAFAGNFDVMALGIAWPEADVMFKQFHSSQMNGGLNISLVSDPDLDSLLESTRSIIDPKERRQSVIEAQQYIVDYAYFLPMYAFTEFNALNNRIVNATLNKYSAHLVLSNAYIEEP